MKLWVSQPVCLSLLRIAALCAPLAVAAVGQAVVLADDGAATATAGAPSTPETDIAETFEELLAAHRLPEAEALAREALAAAEARHGQASATTCSLVISTSRSWHSGSRPSGPPPYTWPAP